MSLRFRLSGWLNQSLRQGASLCGLRGLPCLFNGRLLRFPLNSWTSIRVQYEPYLASLLTRHLHTGGVFLDVGAHMGHWSIFAASLVGRMGKVISCEPSPSFRCVASAAALYPAIDPRSIGIGSKDGDFNFFAQGMASSGSFIQEVTAINRHFQSAVPITSKTTTVRTIDSLLKEARVKPSVVKVDVEGFELEVLIGARRTLAELDASWVIEVHPPQLELSGGSENDLFGLLAENRYDFSVIDRNPNSLYTIFAVKNAE